MPETAAVGELRVRTDRQERGVTVDGVPVASFDARERPCAGRALGAPRSHLGAVRQVVTVEAGTTASLVVPLARWRRRTGFGLVSVSCPIEVQLFEGDR